MHTLYVILLSDGKLYLSLFIQHSYSFVVLLSSQCETALYSIGAKAQTHRTDYKETEEKVTKKNEKSFQRKKKNYLFRSSFVWRAE